MTKRIKHPKLPNGWGSIKYLGANRRNPYAVHPPTKEFTLTGIPKTPKALCYVDDWYKAFTVLTWYHNGEYYPGREQELSNDADELKKQISGVLTKYNQTKREIADNKTFTDVFNDFYKDKYGKEYALEHTTRTASERSTRTAYKKCAALYQQSFRLLTTNDLQEVVDDCKLKHSSLELIVSLFHQMYHYAVANDLCDKDYSKYVKIKIADDDEHGEPFTDADLRKLWEHSSDSTVSMILIMCYSGFRISEYIGLNIDLMNDLFIGGIKTDAGRNRIVPIHSVIKPLVMKRLNLMDMDLITAPQKFRNEMYKKLDELGIDRHTPHDCRHTFSYLCNKYHVNEIDKKLMMGHSFQDVTNKVYLHRNPEDLKIEIEKIKCD